MNADLTDLTWACHVCGAVRPDALIGVYQRRYRHRDSDVELTENVRYCRDRVECREGAAGLRFFAGADQEEPEPWVELDAGYVPASADPRGPFEPSPARRGLDTLLAATQHLELVDAEWQRDGPWLLVTLGQPSENGRPAFALHHYAIWRSTGAVHGMHGGEVTDEPMLQP